MGILPNPGFDAGSFDNSAFDCTLPLDISAANSGVSRDRQGEEWYVCDRCGWYYPRSKMLNQNGLNVCYGATTRNCRDEPGHAATLRDLQLPFEEVPQPLPHEDDEL